LDDYAQAGGTSLLSGGASLCHSILLLHCYLLTAVPKTLNGLILEHMETIPEPGTSLVLEGLPVTIVQVHENRVKMARVQPRPRRNRQRRD
jgi:Mg2+/Co2+ transporter CorB